MLLCALFSPVLLGKPTAITLEGSSSHTPSDIGHIHVFSGKTQIIKLNIIPSFKEKISAYLYRKAGSTLVPVANPFPVTASEKIPTTITVDFPKSEKTTQYVLIFNTLPKAHLTITAHPPTLLAPIRKSAKHTPIQFFNASAKLLKIFHHFSIPSRVLDDLNSVSEGVLILSDTNHPNLDNITANRIIISSASIPKNREIWVSHKPHQWKITIPSYYLAPDYLKTAAGQACLKRIIISNPN